MINNKIGFVVIVLLLIGSILATSGCTQEQEEKLYPNNNNQTTTTQGNYNIVDTGQNSCFDNTQTISCPEPDESFYGQDAQYYGNQPSYQDNGDGTVTDLNTGLMWQQSFDHNEDGDIDYDDKLSYDEILTMVDSGVTYAGYSDWRLPTIKEQYSLIMFSGRDISGYEGSSTDGLNPFIDTNYFEFAYGDTDAGERLIDVQCTTTNVYVAGNEEMVFGVNFADGRIKGYGTTLFGRPKAFNYLLVRSQTEYGKNNFIDNGDGTITDVSTGLMWMQDDNGEGVLWKDALSYAEDNEFTGYYDWRMPNAKELQSIVDYTRSPDTTDSAAIDPVFTCSQITNEAEEVDYPFYWSSTTHETWVEGNEGAWGIYVSFGRSMGNMNGWVDVHGAGAQRSDPKTGDPDEFSDGHGPQGDAVRIYNYVRCVRGGLSDNQAPEKPDTPEGQTSGGSGTEYNFTSSTIDPDNDLVYCWFDWGDNSNSGWLGPYESGEIVTASHIWGSKGNYELKVKAKDTDGAQSEWSDQLEISMPKTKYTLCSLFIQFCQKILERFQFGDFIPHIF